MACGSGKLTIQLVDEEAGPGAGGPKPFRGQNYEAIRAACLDEGILFRDPYFPAGADALGYDQLGPDSEKAKGEFCAEPQFICEDMSRTDVCQGSLGNCWFLAAAASLTLYPRLLWRVVPPGQGFRDGYAGVFHFQLWQFGSWVDIVVDDRLPVREGKLMFVRSEQRNEFWASLLEKAYAKLHGSYEVMRGGHMNEAFVDFTGGVGEVLYLRQDTPGLFSALRHALAKESLVGATALSDRGEYRTEDGLVKGHAYSVTGTHKVSLGFTKVRLLRLRNPWGRVEWTGAWSDSCPRWDALPAEWRDALLVKKEDGEFWMELRDFLCHFNTVQICSLSPEVLGPHPAGGGWHIHTFQGRWVRGFNSGGSQPAAETFWTNPQFRLTLLEPDDEEDNEEGPWGGWGAAGANGPARGGRVPKCTVLLSLIQRNRRCLRAQGLTYLTVGFHVFQAPYVPLELGLEQLFKELAGEEEELGAPQLQALLSIALEPASVHPRTPADIGLRTCEQLLQCFVVHDGDRAWHGRSLALHDFQQLWSHLQRWQAIFDKFDRDASGTMNSHELRLALNAAGFHLNNQLTQALTSRHRDSRLRVDFERFVSCVAQLICIFREGHPGTGHCSQHLDGGEGVICLTRSQWLEVATF
ncbi:Calpain-12 [Pteropus alecto]|uniref:Calpain-12 n=1 Tax=Pteropus alecto TaxID=9402 RepID=L5KNG0_PTEAL|nr:Calpain-12 [Pteropus alecto]